jgi:hypothetical protein
LKKQIAEADEENLKLKEIVSKKNEDLFSLG